MLRITFPYLFFISLVAFAGGILNSFNQFAIPAFTPVFLNICLIGAALWAAPFFEQPVIALAWGVALAGFTQLAFQLPFLARLGLMPRPRFKRDHEGVKKISKLMIPAIIGSSVAQINLLLDTIIASFLIAGSVSWLYFSDRLVEFPLGVFGIALATVILPNLSKQHANQSIEDFNHTIDWALRLVMLIAVPAAIGLLLLSQPILATLFQYGEFNSHDSYMSSLSLMAYALGLPAFIIIKVLAPAFYARQDTKTPMKIAVKAMSANMLLNILFVVPMVYYVYEAPHVGLALATSASAYMNAALLFFALRKQNIYSPQKGWGMLYLQLIIANALLAGFILYWSPTLDIWTNWSLQDRLINLVMTIVIAAILYLASLLLCGLRPKLLKR
ncbi:MAG: murein biosynthesis integral membrane protein MurJ, partial [Gammaproteobacteria bacterium]|nr:murein biosynthesis integral membrane protein MurJ [Gammaproteobacteria bacterium]